MFLRSRESIKKSDILIKYNEILLVCLYYFFFTLYIHIHNCKISHTYIYCSSPKLNDIQFICVKIPQQFRNQFKIINNNKEHRKYFKKAAIKVIGVHTYIL